MTMPPATSAPSSARLPRMPGPDAPVRRLLGRTVGADWGDPRLLAPFLALAERSDPDTRPAAEIWFGAHPRHPSVAVDGEVRTAADLLPDAQRPTFLVKLLAAAGPLSVQVHPDAATARRRWDDEEAAGIPRDAPGRRSADPFPKPELIRAIGPFRALCGLRPAATSRALLTALVPSGAESLIGPLAHGDAGIGQVVTAMLRADRRTVAGVLAEVTAGAGRALAEGAEDAGVDRAALLRFAQLALDLVARFPDDPGVLVALLLEDVDLAPGEALAVAPGTPHAYLSGLALEVMAPSDNVSRGGMTTKPVDVDDFLETLDRRAIGAPRIGTLPRTRDRNGWRRHIGPSDAFVLDEVDLDGASRVERSGRGPSILVCADGAVTVSAGGGAPVDLGAGGAALLDAGVTPVEVRGRGLVLHAGPGRAPVPLTPVLSDLTSG